MTGAVRKRRAFLTRAVVVAGAALTGLVVLCYPRPDRYRIVAVLPRAGPPPGPPLPCAALVKTAVSQEPDLDIGARDVLTLLADTFDRQRLAAFRAKQVATMHVGGDTDVRARVESLSECQDDALPKLGFCAVSSGSAPYVQEWVSHHLLLGARKIVLYDADKPGSTRSREFRRAVTPFVDAGYVDIVGWHSRPSPAANRTYQQVEAKDHCLERYRSELDWIAVTELDEFVVFRPSAPGGGCLPRLLAEEHGASDVLPLPVREFAPLGVPVHDHSRTTLDQYRYASRNSSSEPVRAGVIVNAKKMHAEGGAIPPGFAASSSGDPLSSFDLNRLSARRPSAVDAGPPPAPLEPDMQLGLHRYWARGMQHVLLEKVCGPSQQQEDQAEANARAMARHLNSRNFAFHADGGFRQSETLGKFLFG